MKTAREEDLTAQLAELTPAHLPHGRGSTEEGTGLLPSGENLFEDRCPTTTAAFEGETAAGARDLELYDELAAVTHLAERTLRERPADVHGAAGRAARRPVVEGMGRAVSSPGRVPDAACRRKAE